MKTTNLILISLLFVATHAQPSSANNRLPSDWYQMPEDAASTNYDVLEMDRIDKGFSLEKILQATSEALESGKIAPPELKNPPKDSVPWRLVSFMMEFGVSIRGLIGSLILEGNPAFAISWGKKEGSSNLTTFDRVDEKQEHSADPLKLSVRDDALPSELVRSIEPLVRAAMATGRVENEALLRAELLRNMEIMRSWALASRSHSRSQWSVSSLRFDLSVAVSGKVTLSSSAGTAVRLAVVWIKTKDKVSNQTRSILSASRTSDLQNLLTDLADDLMVLANNDHLIPSFRPKDFRVGLGVSLSGDVGIVKGSAGLFMHVFFERSAKNMTGAGAQFPMSLNSSRPIKLITYKPTPLHIEFAENKNISFTAVDTDLDGIVDEATYKLDRKAYRRGLRKAVDMGAYFARAAMTAETTNWKIQDISVGLDMSITGDMNLVKVTGIASSDIGFESLSTSKAHTAFTTPVALGTPHPELTRFVHEQITGLRKSLLNSPTSEDPEFELHRFLLRLRAKLGIKVPIFSYFEVVPEVEFVVQKSAQ